MIVNNVLCALFLFVPGVLKCVLAINDDCCSIFQMEENQEASLINCVNSSTNSLLDMFETKIGPSLNVVIVTRATPNIYGYAAFSYFIQQQYATYNLYTLLPLYDDSMTEDYVYHRKLVPLLEALDDVENPDYIVWMDADLIPLDFTLRLEQVAQQHSDAHILMSSDVSSLANTGLIIVRNSQWSRQFLRDWIEQRNVPGVVNEQLGFESVCRLRGARETSEKIAILPAEVLNSLAPPMGQQLPHHQVLHLAAEASEMRAAVFRQAATNICVSKRERTALPHQLGINREFLQRTAVKVYQELYLVLQPALLQANKDPALTAHIVAEYRSAVSKYCHALVYSSVDGKESAATIAIRRRALSIVRGISTRVLLSVDAYRRMVTFQGNVELNRESLTLWEEGDEEERATRRQEWQSLPELLKYAAELAFELLATTGGDDRYISVSEQAELVQYVLDTTTTLLGVVHPSQREVVQAMKDAFAAQLVAVDSA